MDAQRIVITTFLLVVAGAVAGVIVAFASLAPVWLGMTPLRDSLTSSWFLSIVAVMGACLGALVMPVFGWFVIRRVGFWRAVLEPTVAAIAGAMLLSLALRSLQTDVLIGGAFLGALLGTARLRFSSGNGRRDPTSG